MDEDYETNAEIRTEAEEKVGNCKARRIIIGVIIELFIALGSILYLLFSIILLIISLVEQSRPENSDFSTSIAILAGVGLYAPMWDNVSMLGGKTISLFNNSWFPAQ